MASAKQGAPIPRPTRAPLTRTHSARRRRCAQRRQLQLGALFRHTPRAGPRRGPCRRYAAPPLGACVSNRGSQLTCRALVDAARFGLLLVDACSVRQAVSRAFPEQVLIGVIRMVRT